MHSFRSAWARIIFATSAVTGFVANASWATAEPQEPPAADTVVVCPADFRAALAPWAAHRARQGHVLQFTRNTNSTTEIRREIREAAAGGRLKWILLVGDSYPAAGTRPAEAERCVPSFIAKAQVNTRWGSEPHIATDNHYADLDDDQVPDVAIGRITPDTPEELQTIVEKILAYERSTDQGAWRSTIHCVAGMGGFGAIVDNAIEAGARQFLTDEIPAAYRVTMTYGSWRSPFCPDPGRLHEAVVDRMNEGSLFWVYIGHGSPNALDKVSVQGKRYHLLDTADMNRLNCGHGSPIAIMLACYTAAFDSREDCLAEEMLRARGGPVAIIGGTRVTMPYAMGVMATEALDEVFDRRRPTIGEVMLAAKRNSVRKDRDDGRSKTLDTIGWLLSPRGSDLSAERMEHLLLFHLIGDPLLRIAQPSPLDLKVAPRGVAGDRLEVQGTTPHDGFATAELMLRRDRLAIELPKRDDNLTEDRRTEMNMTYQQANDRTVSIKKIAVRRGRFLTQLDVPPNVDGVCHVRVFVEGREACALGAVDVTIDKRARQAARAD